MDGHLSTYRTYSLEQLITFCKPGFNNKGINTTTVHFIRESMGNTQTNYYGVNLRIEEKMGGSLFPSLRNSQNGFLLILVYSLKMIIVIANYGDIHMFKIFINSFFVPITVCIIYKSVIYVTNNQS